MLEGLGFISRALEYKSRNLPVAPLSLDSLVKLGDESALLEVAKETEGFGQFETDLGSDLVTLSTLMENNRFAQMTRGIDAEEDPELSRELGIAYFDEMEKVKESYIMQNFYPVEMFNTHAAIDSKINIIKKKFGLKPWLPDSPEYANVRNKLSEVEKQEIIDLLVPALYVPTLVHEWGHNLGLRHNFMGSMDKDNWYAHKHDHDAENLESNPSIEVKEDIKFFDQLGIKRKLEYSSIMDYAYGTMNELNIMGKYDIAALRFAYGFARDPSTGALEDSALEFVKKNDDGVIVDKMIVANTPSGKQLALEAGFQLRDYMFCTDEAVSLNATCNRFDEGTNYTEVVQHYIDSYEDNYHLRNLRNGRKYFSKGNGLVSYTLRIRDTFRNLRLPFELYEKIKQNPQLGDNSPEWFTNPFLKDIRQAAAISGQFFLQVITTPDALCRISPRANPVETFKQAPYVPLSVFGDRFAHCGEVPLAREDIMISGQVGKPLLSRKSRFNPSSYIDEVDTLGVWPDKLLAAEALFARDTGVASDNVDDNYLAMPELRQPILNTVDQIFNDQLFGEVRVSLEPVFSQFPDLALGGSQVAPLSYSLYSNGAGEIQKPLSRQLRYYFGLPNRATSLQKALVKIIKRNAVSERDVEIRNIMSQYADAEYIDPFRSDFDVESFEAADGYTYLDPSFNKLYLAYPENKTARRSIRFLKETDMNDENSTLFKMDSFIENIPDDLDPVNPDHAEAIAMQKELNRQMVLQVALMRNQAEASGEEINVGGLPPEMQQMFEWDNEIVIGALTNSLKPKEFYLFSLRNFSGLQ
ncbi:MAG: hypothetical protein R2827_06005 [Bdellovibrionales bacterium]